MHSRGIEPAEERRIRPDLTLHEIDGRGGGFVVDRFHTLSGERSGILDCLRGFIALPQRHDYRPPVVVASCFRSIVTLSSLPVNLNGILASYSSMTGVPVSWPTSKLSSSENLPSGFVCSIRDSLTFLPSTESVPSPPLPRPPPS